MRYAQLPVPYIRLSMVARSSFLSSVNRFHLELFFAGFRCFAGVTIIVTTDTKVVGRDLSLSLEYVTATVKKKSVLRCL